MYFNVNQDKKNYKKQITKIITKVLSSDHVDIGDNYITSDPNENNTNEMKINSNHLFDKLKKSTINLNLNISKNYYKKKIL